MPSRPEFKPGDRVVPIGHPFGGLKDGNEYTVDICHGTYLWLVGFERSFYPGYFNLVTTPPSEEADYHFFNGAAYP